MKASLLTYNFKKLQKKSELIIVKNRGCQKYPETHIWALRILRVKKIENKKWERERRVRLKENYFFKWERGGGRGSGRENFIKKMGEGEGVKRRVKKNGRRRGRGSGRENKKKGNGRRRGSEEESKRNGRGRGRVREKENKKKLYGRGRV
jgi:hypothetical protein